MLQLLPSPSYSRGNSVLLSVLPRRKLFNSQDNSNCFCQVDSHHNILFKIFHRFTASTLAATFASQPHDKLIWHRKRVIIFVNKVRPPVLEKRLADCTCCNFSQVPPTAAAILCFFLFFLVGNYLIYKITVIVSAR